MIRRCSKALIAPQGPIIDRTLIPDPSGLYSLFYKDFTDYLKSSPDGTVVPSTVADDIILATFKLNPGQIQNLKRLALSKAVERNISFHCSTIVVAFAYTWVCFVRTKDIDSKKSSIAFSADFRYRLQPPIPKEYFGNCVRSCDAILYTSDLIKEVGFASAAEAIGKDIKRMSRDVIKGAENWPKGSFALREGTSMLQWPGCQNLGFMRWILGLGGR